MKKSIFLLLFALFLLASACQKSTEETNKELYNQVMDIHDEMMPKMGAFHSMRKALGTKMSFSDSLGFSMEQLQNDLALVDSADHAMRVWMREFNPDEYKGDELTVYLKAELVKVLEMKEIMNRALARREDIEN